MDMKEFLNFKLKQHARLSNFNYKSENAKENLKQITKDNLKNWVSEGIAAGI